MVDGRDMYIYRYRYRYRYMNKGRPLNIIYTGIQNVNTEKFNAERSFFFSYSLFNDFVEYLLFFRFCARHMSTTKWLILQ